MTSGISSKKAVRTHLRWDEDQVVIAQTQEPKFAEFPNTSRQHFQGVFVRFEFLQRGQVADVIRQTLQLIVADF